MNLLLDTHIIIWFANGDEKLTGKIKEQTVTLKIILCAARFHYLKLPLKPTWVN